jgi:hypothetical protein
MKFVRKAEISIKGFAALALACLLSPAQGAVLEMFLPAVQSVQVGGQFQVQIQVSGLGDLVAPALYGYDIGVAFEPSAIALKSVAFGDPALGDQLGLLVSPITSFDSSHSGLVFLHEEQGAPVTGLEDMQLGSFVLATLTFEATSPGTSNLGVVSAALIDGQGSEIPLDFGPPAASVTAAVPEPSLLVLLVLGLAGLGLPYARHACHADRVIYRLRQSSRNWLGTRLAIIPSPS